MASVRLWSLAGIAVLAAGTVTLPPGEIPLLAVEDAHDTYVGCLNASYDASAGERGGKVVLAAYLACPAQEQGYKSYLGGKGVAPERVRHVVERVNEAAYARHLGVGIERTRGCLTYALEGRPIS